MTGLPPRIWVADALRAVDALAADPVSAGHITDLLLPHVRASTIPAETVAAPLPAPGPVAVDVTVRRQEIAISTRDLVAASAPAGSAAAPVVIATRPAPTAAPRTLPRIATLLDTPTAAVPPPADLLAPRHQRALLSAVCSGVSESDEIDTDAAVERIAGGEPVDPLPRRLRPTTRRGLEVLVDHGDAMAAFAADQAAVVRVVSRIAGPDGLHVLRFATTPLDDPGAGPGPMPKWRPYRPQPAGVPVLALTDLGLLAPPPVRAGVQERWIRFAGLLREAGCPFVALVPVPPARIPVRLRRAVSTVLWDRPTRVRDAVVAVRRAGGRHR